MARGSIAEGFGKVVLGGAVGFGLYMLITGLGFGGLGRGEGAGRGEAEGPPPPAPPAAPPPPPRPKDDKRLSFVMIEPKVLGHPMGFRLRDGDPKKTYSLDELIARVKEGGRTDVELRASGAVIQGPWDEAQERIKSAGLKLWLVETSPAAPQHVVGFLPRANDRGQYGRRWT